MCEKGRESARVESRIFGCWVGLIGDIVYKAPYLYIIK